MISDSAESVVVSHPTIGDKSLWVCDTMPVRVRSIRLSGAEFLDLYPGTGGAFALVHLFAEPRLLISAHRFERPEAPVAEIDILPGEVQFRGDSSIWMSLPRAYVGTGWGPMPGWEWAGDLLLVDSERLSVAHERLDWYSSGQFDYGYQRLLSVTEVPDSELLMLCIQRSSSLYLHDPKTSRLVRTVPLAGRHSCQDVLFRKSSSEVWATDYDTLLRLDLRDYTIKDSQRLEPGTDHPSWIGTPSFNTDETICVVPRPKRGDALLINADTFSVEASIVTGGDPYEAVLLKDGRLLARSISTGDLLVGQRDS